MGQVEAHPEGVLAGVEEDLEGGDQGDQGDGAGMVPEVGAPAEGEGVLVGDRNPEEAGQEAMVPREAAQTHQGRALEEEVCPHVEAQPEVGEDLDLEEGQEGQEEQGGLEEAVGVPAYQESEVEALQDQEDRGSGLDQGVLGTCPCHFVHPWGILETLQGAQPYLPQTSVPTECLSFYVTASQTGSGTVCCMV